MRCVVLLDRRLKAMHSRLRVSVLLFATLNFLIMFLLYIHQVLVYVTPSASRHLESSPSLPLNLRTLCSSTSLPLTIHTSVHDGIRCGPVLDEMRGPSNLNLTLVSSYFDIGSFSKGGTKRGTDDYIQWLQPLSLLNSPFIFYTNSTHFIHLISTVRRDLVNLTRIHFIPTDVLLKTWSFSLLPRIRRIFNQSGYPKHPPNTVLPAYSCIMHVKYELVALALQDNVFDSTHFAWLDVGEYRFLNANTTPPFTLHPPPHLQPLAVAYNAVSAREDGLTTMQIVSRNLVWANGGMFLAERGVMLAWTRYYRTYVEQMLEDNVMSTDQQVIYSMFSSKASRLKHSFHIQTYEPGDTGYAGNEWMFLAYYASPQLREIYCPRNNSLPNILHHHGLL